MKIGQEKNQYIDFAKFFACIFITNSHCLYENPLFKLGGGWGNSIFFAVSGFLLGNITIEFLPWLKKRWIRIVPLTIVMTVLSALFYGIDSCSTFNHATRFWFVIAILIYYIPFYFADKIKMGGYLIFIGVHILGYIVLYSIRDKTQFFVELGGFALFKVYFYFIVMLFGGAVKKYIDKFDTKRPIVFMITGGIGFAVWFLEYYAVKVLGKFIQYQFLINVGITIFGISVLLWALAMNRYYPGKKLLKFIEIIANSTLEVYLVQITFLPFISKVTYPFSIACFWIVAILGGVILHEVVNQISTKIRK